MSGLICTSLRDKKTLFVAKTALQCSTEQLIAEKVTHEHPTHRTDLRTLLFRDKLHRQTENI